jgi:hypothetical protein
LSEFSKINDMQWKWLDYFQNNLDGKWTFNPSIIVQELLVQNNLSIFKEMFTMDLHYTLNQKNTSVPLPFGKGKKVQRPLPLPQFRRTWLV